MYKLLLKFVVSVLFIGLLIYTTDLQLVIDHLNTMNIETVLMCTVLVFVLVIPQTIRWMIILGAMDSELVFRRALATTMVGWFFNQVLPSSVGGDAFRIWYAYRFGIKLSTSIYSVVTDRVTGLVSLFLLVSVSLPWLLGLPGKNDIVTGFVVAFEFIFISAFLVLLSDNLIGKVLPKKISARFTELCTAIRCVLFHWKSVPVILLSIIIHLTIALVVWLLAKDMLIPLSLSQSMISIPLVLLATAIPVSIAGWGIREGAMVLVLGSIGIVSDAALALSILLGIIIMISGLPGGVVWMFMHHEKPHLEEAVVETLESC